MVELASVLAGPSVGQFFAELGADVIKIENLKTGGDVTRTWKGRDEISDDRSAYFSSVNWGKRSVAVDLESRQGKEIVYKMVAKATLVIASYKPGDAEKLGVDYQSLITVNPSIIYGQITGYGSGNPRVGYDAVVQAEGGFMFMNGVPGGSSLKMPVALIDVLAAHHLKEAILLAMLHKEKTGKGAFVEVSLLQAAIASLVNQATNWLMAGAIPQKQGSAHPNIAPYGDTFETHDGVEVLLAIGNDKQFVDLCRILQIPEIAQQSEYMNNKARVNNRDLLKTILLHRIKTFESAYLINLLHRAKIPAGLIHSMDQVFELPEARELVLSGVSLAGVRSFAAKSALFELRTLLPPPHFGEHTIEVVNTL